MRPSFYNNNVQILQVPGSVVLLNEMIHDIRIIPLDGRPHVSPYIQKWQGDSRGHWDGNVLVVETTNFRVGGSPFGSTTGVRVIERLSRADAKTIDYEFTIIDPQVYTKPWTAAFPLTKTEEQIFEYACHEGNYRTMEGLLGTARADEKAVEEAAKKKK
jgi:hypothetical protein